jgi:hypothetical protein
MTMTAQDRALFEQLSAKAEEHANYWLSQRQTLRVAAEHQQDAAMATLLRHLARKAEIALSGLAPIACALGCLTQGGGVRSALWLAGGTELADAATEEPDASL